MTQPWKNLRGNKLALAICLALAGASCTTTPPPAPQPFKQIVLVWLKNPSSATDRTQVTRAAQALRMMPGVVKVSTGRAAPLPATATDRSFDLGVVVIFRDRSAYERYHRDPKNAQAMERFLRPLVERYEIYGQDDR